MPLTALPRSPEPLFPLPNRSPALSRIPQQLPDPAFHTAQHGQPPSLALSARPPPSTLMTKKDNASQNPPSPTLRIPVMLKVLAPGQVRFQSSSRLIDLRWLLTAIIMTITEEVQI